MATIPLIELQGSASEKGFSHGETFSNEINRNIEFYLEYFAAKGVSEQDAYSYAENAIRLVNRLKPGFIDEMQGVADGSNRTLEDIALINFRHTILYSAYADSDPDGCTGFGLEPEATENGRTYIGQNWDWKCRVEKLIMKNRREKGPDFMALTEAGNVGGKFGLNENGIGFTVNGLNTPEDGQNPDRIPSHVIGRNILESKRLDQAVEAVIGQDRPTSRNYILARMEGEIINIETTPTEHYFMYPENHVITHANHFENSNVESTLEKRVPHSVTRKARIKRLFNGKEHYSENDIKDFLQDHVGKPKSICRHPQDKENGSMTKSSVILDLEDRKMIAADGPPCENKYREYRL